MTPSAPRRLTGNVMVSAVFDRSGADGRITVVTVTLNSPDNDSPGNYAIQTKVFSPNLAP